MAGSNLKRVEQDESDSALSSGYLDNVATTSILQQPLSVLLVEDDYSDAVLVNRLIEMINRSLARHGGSFSLVRVASLAEALDLLSQLEFDIMLIDLTLPDSEGLSTFETLHEAYPSVPKVVLTALDDLDLAIQALHNGAQDYLVKSEVVASSLGRSLLYATRRTKREREQSELEDKFRQLNRFKTVGCIAGAIAHDFNNMLTAILGNVSLAKELNEDAQVDHHLRCVDTAARRAADVVKQLLLYSGRGVADKKVIDVPELIESVLELLQASVPQDVQLKLDLTDANLTVFADTVQVMQVLVNFIINAAEATSCVDGRSKEVMVSASKVTFHERRDDFSYAQAPLEPGNYVQIGVEDNGCGMSDEVRQHLFDPFFTTKFLGRGLGLASVWGIVSNHGGRILVESREGHGARFMVYLPEVIDTEDLEDSSVESCKGQPR